MLIKFFQAAPAERILRGLAAASGSTQRDARRGSSERGRVEAHSLALVGQIPAKAESTRTRKVGSWRSSGDRILGVSRRWDDSGRHVRRDGGGRGQAQERAATPEVNRVLYVRNLPFNITADEMYDIFGKYGAIRQIRLGDKKDTKGTAYVVYEDIYDAKQAVDHLSGFNVANRYLIVLYYNPAKTSKKADQARKAAEIAKLQEKYGVDGQSDTL